MRAQSIFMLVVALTTAFAQTDFWDGTADTTWYTSNKSAETFTITTPQELRGLALLVNGSTNNGRYNMNDKTITLGNDITLNDTDNWEDWETNPPANSWTAIGTSSNSFNGTFDGDSHTVSGIYINTTNSYQGLFGYLGNGGTVKNIGILDSYIENGSYYVNGGSYVGRLLGYNSYGTVSNSYASGKIMGYSNDVGGLVGYNNGTINNSYSTDTVIGNNYVGGLVGYNNNGTINNSYSTDAVIGNNYVGGLVGVNLGYVNSSYSAGPVMGNSPVGGLIGYSISGVTNSYYDKTISGETDTGKGEGKTTEEMQSLEFANTLNAGATVLSMNAWNYLTGKYPELTNAPFKTVNSYFSSGNGTETNPYIINTRHELENLSNLVNAGKDFINEYLKLGNDIDLSEPFRPWTAIGTWSPENPFNGTFDGDGHIVSGVYIYIASDCQGLFGYLGSNGTVKNVGVIDSYVNGEIDVGCLVGMNKGTVSNSYSNCTVTGTGNALASSYGAGSGTGGLVGYNYGGTISNSYSIGKVTGKGNGDYVGGLVGSNLSGTVRNSYYNTQASGQADSGKGDGKTATYMKSQEFTNILNAGANILSMNVWTYSSGEYPVLSNTLTNMSISSHFASGNGTEASPYIIKTKEQLENLSFAVSLGIDFNDKYFKLGNNIALNNTENWRNWETVPPVNSWTMIGTRPYNPFNGTFDGDGHIVSGVYINTTANYQGLFGYLGEEGTIKNVGIVDSYIKGGAYVGGLVGAIVVGTVSSSYFAGMVTGSGYVGGLVGANVGTISNSYATGTVTGSAEYIGGLVGGNLGTANSSYSTSAVTGTGSYVGGLVGRNDDSNGIISGSYYDTQTSGQTDEGKGEGKTTEQMKQMSTYVGWNFNGVWKIDAAKNNGYPYLFINITPTIADLTFTIPTNHIYTGIQQGIGEVTGANGMGAITVLYDGSPIIPIDAGTYIVTVNIAEGTIFGALNDIWLGEYVIAATIDPIISLTNPSIGVGVHTIGNKIMLTNLPQGAKVEIYNLNGKRIYSTSNSTIPIQAKGVYIIRIGGQTFRVSVK